MTQAELDELNTLWGGILMSCKALIYMKKVASSHHIDIYAIDNQYYSLMKKTAALARSLGCLPADCVCDQNRKTLVAHKVCGNIATNMWCAPGLKTLCPHCKAELAT